MLNVPAALEALGDATRRRIFEHIVVRPARVGELAELVDVTRSAVSFHVKVLKSAGLVEGREDGRLHTVAPALPELRTYFDRLWLEASLGDAWLLERRAWIGDHGF